MTSSGRGNHTAGITVAIALLFAGASAAQFDVDSVLDAVDDNPGNGTCHTAAGTCTLRAAVMEANRLGGDTIRINLPAGTFHRTLAASGGDGDESGDLNLTAGQATIIFQGEGSSRTIIDADHLGRAFWVYSGRSAEFLDVTIRNGTVLTGYGGGIRNEGLLQVTSSVISGNSAPSYGAGIYNSGRVILLESTLSGNHDAGWGGGLAHLAIAPAATSILTRCTISGNSAYLAGGGIYTGPSAVNLFIENSTISGNHSVTDGGGIGNFGTTWTYNATIAFNEANSDADPDGSGGGVFNSGAFYPRNSVIAGNTHSGSPDLDDCTGELGIFGKNRISTESGCKLSPQNGDAGYKLIGSLSQLGPLRFNGGSTMTHALISPSDMIDAGIACNGLGDPPVDQRGGLRTPELTCDIGAVERGALHVDLIFADGFESDDLRVWG